MSIFYPLLAVLPIGFLMAIVAIWRKFENANGLKQPINGSEKFLRTPGYSAFNEVRRLNEKLDDLLFWFTGFPALMVLAYLAPKISGKPLPPYFAEIFFGGFAIVFVCMTLRLISVGKKRRTWELGLRGERAVGEYLNQLMLHECRVFHDFPLNGNGNLDHIVVAPSGVYAIETKTKSKRSKLRENHIVKYDGKKLIFPDGWTDTDDLSQAYKQANQLSRLLRDTLDMPINVEPMLTFPGWFVKTCALGDVQVLNPKQIHTAIVETDPILSPPQIQKIAAYLDTRCRDVEF